METTAIPKPTTVHREYLMAEYRTATTEIQNHLAEIRTRERFAITSLAATGAWIVVEFLSKSDSHSWFGQNNVVVVKGLLIITEIVLALLGTSIFLLDKNIEILGTYIKRIETEFLGDGKTIGINFGWENELAKKPHGLYFGFLSYATWVFYLGLPVVLFLLL